VPDLVLRTRLALLRDNLDRVVQAKAAIDKAQARYREFLEFPGREVSLVNDLLDLCDDAKGALRRGYTQDVQDQLRALDDRLNDLRDVVLTLKSTAAEQMERADALAAMSARMDVKNFLVDHARETRSALVDTWDSYMAFAPTCESLFNEYVDVLRGIAVREA